MNGDAETGVSVMRMVEKLDAGDIMLQKKIAIHPGDNLQALESKLAETGAVSLIENSRVSFDFSTTVFVTAK